MNYSITSGSTQQHSPVCEADIPQQLRALESTLEDMEKTVEGLSNRLASVLRTEPVSSNAEGGGCPKPANCDLGERIASYTRRLIGFNSKLVSLIQRTEL